MAQKIIGAALMAAGALVTFLSPAAARRWWQVAEPDTHRGVLLAKAGGFVLAAAGMLVLVSA